MIFWKCRRYFFFDCQRKNEIKFVIWSNYWNFFVNSLKFWIRFIVRLYIWCSKFTIVFSIISKMFEKNWIENSWYEKKNCWKIWKLSKIKLSNIKIERKIFWTCYTMSRFCWIFLMMMKYLSNEKKRKWWKMKKKNWNVLRNLYEKYNIKFFDQTIDYKL